MVKSDYSRMLMIIISLRHMYGNKQNKNGIKLEMLSVQVHPLKAIMKETSTSLKVNTIISLTLKMIVISRDSYLLMRGTVHWKLLRNSLLERDLIKDIQNKLHPSLELILKAEENPILIILIISNRHNIHKANTFLIIS